MASSVSFILIFSSIAGLLLAVKNGYAYSTSEENKNFERHTSNAIEDMQRSFMENVSSVEADAPHGEIAAETMKKVHLNFNHSMLNKRVATECDLFSGTWVRDESYPLYPGGKCPYLHEGI